MTIAHFGASAASAAENLEVSARLDGRSNSFSGEPIYSGFQLQNDGDEYEYAIFGNVTNLTTWLDSGSASNVWVTWTRTGGSLGDWNSLGSGNNNVGLNLGTTRSFRIVRSSIGTNTITGYCRFHDAPSQGGNLLQTTSTVTWSASWEFESCPLCCFTPDTPVTMASGIEMPIAKVKEGDMILVWDCEINEQVARPVSEIIVRENRPMYRVEFADGRYVNASDDHPFHVKAKKGPASINPTVDYKDIGKPAMLEIGDRVSLQDTSLVKVTSIKRINYSGPVYTFYESLFYANGLLVY